MRIIETAEQIARRAKILDCLEKACEVPRELWEYKRTKKEKEVRIRNIYIYFLYTHGEFNMEEIAFITGLKSHASIVRIVQKIKNTYALKYGTDYIIIETFYKFFNK